MSDQEANSQSAQEDVQNLAEEQLEGVTGAGLGSLAGKVGKCFGCANSRTLSLPGNTPATAAEKSTAMQHLEHAIDSSPMPDHWKIIPKNPNEGSRHA